MAIYIQSAEAISPQDTFRPDSLRFLSPTSEALRQLPEEGYYTCIHPDYKQYINPTSLRRMSPLVRMGMAASKVCMEEAGLEKPDAILVGSGLGCVRDTVKFLNQVTDNQELLLNPTSFIQSTHNTVSGQIALMLGCRAYNLTFSQNTISFETALLEGMMLLDEGQARNILLGGIDEVVEESYRLLEKNGCVNGPVGEGSNFFVISSERSGKSLARVDGLEILNRCEKPEELTGYTLSFLASKGVAAGEIDLFVSGRNGDDGYAHIYSQVEKLFPTDRVMGYKHLVGEYHTASAFGMWLSARLIRENGIPDSEHTVTGLAGTLPIRRALLFNQNKGRDFTWILISHPDT